MQLALTPLVLIHVLVRLGIREVVDGAPILMSALTNGTINAMKTLFATIRLVLILAACSGGFSGSGLSCLNIDECKEGSHKCHENALCNDTPGSYSCSCSIGFSGSGLSCLNIDECRAESHKCHENALCNDTPGSFACSCSNGFSGNGLSCLNIDECREGSHVCHENALLQWYLWFLCL